VVVLLNPERLRDTELRSAVGVAQKKFLYVRAIIGLNDLIENLGDKTTGNNAIQTAGYKAFANYYISPG
jgi:hypothetical protein